MNVYFAHPCFNESQERFKKNFLQNLRAELAGIQNGKAIHIIDPFVNAPNIEGNRETKLKLSRFVKDTCIKMLEESDMVVALVDDGDTGVAFEAGYAHAIGIPVILISRSDCAEANAMLTGAARERFNNILDSEQILRLAHMLEWYDSFIERTNYASSTI
jgi:nucleoside 2-deoxyribosyltransferase